MILWRVRRGDDRSVHGEAIAGRRKRAKQLRAESKLNMDKHYIIYNRITVCRARELSSERCLHIISESMTALVKWRNDMKGPSDL